jgi:hypothetical protein
MIYEYYIKESLALDYVHILVFERKSNVSGTFSGESPERYILTRV